MRTYYLASLLPTSFTDMFFSFRHRLLMRGAISSSSGSGSARPSVLPRKPLPLPGEASPELPSSSKFASQTSERRTSSSSSGTSGSAASRGRGLPHESDTILPQFAPSAPGSSIAPDSGVPSPTGLESRSSAFSSGYASETGKGEDDDQNGGSEGSTPSRSTVLGESYVQI